MTEPRSSTPAQKVGILVPSGMLGAGFPPATIARGIAMGADVIAIDGGSTDSGPYYLGTGTGKTPAEAVRRDLEILLPAAATAGIPLIIGSCATSGTDTGVDWVAHIVDDVLDSENLSLTVAKIYSDQPADRLIEDLTAGRIRPLAPPRTLDAADLRRCTHIVGVMGHEPIAQALHDGADVILAGRATDTAISAALPLMRGMPPGPTWHASKVVECGGQCTTSPLEGGVFAQIDATGFTIEPLAPGARCTPQSVAAHMLYETANPFRMQEPAGTLDVADATYTALDERRVRVEGSAFHPAQQYTIKLEGAAISGYQTMSFTGIRDPQILARIQDWAAAMTTALTARVTHVLELQPGDYDTDLRLYGYNAILGDLDLNRAPPREVGVMLLVNAATQQLATAVAKVANPLMLHLPTPEMTHLPSFAFPASPAETERGATYEFVLNHAVDVDDPCDMFRTDISRSTHA
jgi:hypothetical protein